MIWHHEINKTDLSAYIKYIYLQLLRRFIVLHEFWQKRFKNRMLYGKSLNFIVLSSTFVQQTIKIWKRASIRKNSSEVKFIST